MRRCPSVSRSGCPPKVGGLTTRSTVQSRPPARPTASEIEARELAALQHAPTIIPAHPKYKTRSHLVMFSRLPFLGVGQLRIRLASESLEIVSRFVRVHRHSQELRQSRRVFFV